MSSYTRDQLVELLEENVMTVTFRKISGDERVMRCTLKDDLLPVREQNKPSRTQSQHAVIVWDLDLSNWRSFRIDSLTCDPVVEAS